MPERTGGPTDANSLDEGAPERAGDEPATRAEPTGWERPAATGSPEEEKPDTPKWQRPAGFHPVGDRPDQAVPPIEVGDGPFGLTVSSQPEDPETPGPKSRVRNRVLAGLLALGLAGAAVLSVASWRIASQKDATLTTPAQIGSLKMDETTEGKATADYLTTALAAEVDFDRTVGAVYADPGSPNKAVLFFGGTTLIWSPGNDLESAFELTSDDTGSLKNLHDVDAGELGGTMKCGIGTDEGDFVVCGWADHGSLAIALFPERTEAESAALLRDIRTAVQTRD